MWTWLAHYRGSSMRGWFAILQIPILFWAPLEVTLDCLSAILSLNWEGCVGQDRLITQRQPWPVRRTGKYPEILAGLTGKVGNVLPPLPMLHMFFNATWRGLWSTTHFISWLQRWPWGQTLSLHAGILGAPVLHTYTVYSFPPIFNDFVHRRKKVLLIVEFKSRASGGLDVKRSVPWIFSTISTPSPDLAWQFLYCFKYPHTFLRGLKTGL